MAATTELKLDYLVCPTCARRFGLVAGTGKLSRERLPDPFEAVCPQCNGNLTLPKSAIKVMTLDRSGKIRT